jgi:cytochrome c553
LIKKNLEEEPVGTRKTIVNGRCIRLGAVAAMLLVAMSAPSFAAEIESAIAEGGKLYDNWINITEADDPPMATNPAYPKAGKKRKATTWRCKECHGWDYKGKAGAYAKGSHFSGVAGIRASDGADPAKIVAILKDKNHGIKKEMMMPEELEKVALFVSKGQIDMDKYIDPKSKAIKGDKSMGRNLYETICGNCHGLDGKKIDDMVAMGKVASENPWETLHKIRNGQPDEKMPALRALPIQISVDILAYAVTLPK